MRTCCQTAPPQDHTADCHEPCNETLDVRDARIAELETFVQQFVDVGLGAADSVDVVDRLIVLLDEAARLVPEPATSERQL